MHDYLRAVGFGTLANRRSLQAVLKLVMVSPDQEYYAGDPQQPVYWEKSRDFLPGAGLTIRGDFDETGRLAYEYFFPHYHGEHVSFHGEIELEKVSERDEYRGVSEFSDMGVVMVYHMNRLRDYAGSAGKANEFLEASPVRLSALSIEGSVLIPLARTVLTDTQREREAVAGRRLEAAQNGDPEALAELAIQELDLYSLISRRLENGEDVLSIVESSFMPFGTASDQYLVLGDIISCREQHNQFTGEKLWQLAVLCNGKLIDLCINAEDLTGEPRPGRRFRGTVWLQGQLS